MKKLRILISFFVMLLISTAGYAQEIKAAGDTTAVQVTGKSGNSTAKSQGTANQQGIKQVKGARPDMTRARGARPPQITRPSGSGVPRGLGKPGGAGKKGGR